MELGSWLVGECGEQGLLSFSVSVSESILFFIRAEIPTAIRALLNCHGFLNLSPRYPNAPEGDGFL